ncbi:uncharacterized protein SPPG_02565 [Spizellomyces punctatus DAOM BR117]|uniref:TPR-like protein n=1 Tax=Spizellomyces punctatus (strain DAOM BR117) TaxID=645134 RepID=A0A0L0HLV3_SPIPD|nr:uncharacterized protein SPPG_02565 [Spizellomyces punctatus DAOM BR117]KND02062.1 hypothetical protein SPPG_02565 [Spizellomyces punctatus DAOM BR117]|eukprot:XP_016610101.1 hypothetical protein SPPG_02565 [Spizellomyces punctatus DAOM BR117]
MGDTFHLTQSATQAFLNGRYAEALQHLHQLSSLTDGKDPHVEHNILVAEWYAGKLVGAENLVKRIDGILGMAQLKKEQDDSRDRDPLLADSNGDQVVGSGRDKMTATYNRAVGLYLSGNAQKALDSLRPILDDLEMTDAYVGLRASLLAVECCMALRVPVMARNVLDAAERAFKDRLVRDGEEESADGSSSGLAPTLKDAIPVSCGSLDTVLSVLRTRVYLLEKSKADAKTELSRLENDNPPLETSSSIYRNMSTLYMQAHHAYLHDSPQTAMTALDACTKSTFTPPPTRTPTIPPDDPTPLFKTLPTYYHNALGCLNAKSGNHATAALSFSKALAENQTCIKHLVSQTTPHNTTTISDQDDEKEEWERIAEEQDRLDNDLARTTPLPPSLPTLCNTHPILSYNAGIQLAHLGKPSLAYTCFSRALSTVPSSAHVPPYLLYTHIGLTCLDMYKPTLTPQTITIGHYKLVTPKHQSNVPLQKAQQAFETALEQCPANAVPVIYLYLAYTSLLQRRMEKVLQYCAVVLDHEPIGQSHVLAGLYIRIACITLGRPPPPLLEPLSHSLATVLGLFEQTVAARGTYPPHPALPSLLSRLEGAVREYEGGKGALVWIALARGDKRAAWEALGGEKKREQRSVGGDEWGF